MESIKLITDLYKYNTGYLLKHFARIDKSILYSRPNHRLNPIVWIFGHIVVSRGSLSELLGGELENRNLSYYFSSGTKPLKDTSEYPSFDKILGSLSKYGAKLNRLIAEGGDSLLNRQVWGDYDTIGKHVVSSYIHESYHIGQISYLKNQIEKTSSRYSLKFTNKKKESTGKILLDSLKSVLTVR